MKNIKKLFTALMIILVMLINVATTAFASESKVVVPSNDSADKYFSMIIGCTEEYLNTEMKLEYTAEEFLEAIKSALRGHRYTDDMQNQERGIVLGNIKLSLSTKDCAKLFGISEQLVSEHIEICGNNLYNKIIKAFNEDPNAKNNETADVSAKIAADEWRIFYADATVGNIFLTKDASTLGYTHGHAGVIQSSSGSIKYISEAMGPNTNNADEVRWRTLDNWSSFSTLCAMYPNTLTVTDRIDAGNQTYYYTIDDNYTYEFNNKKVNLKDYQYTKLNCVGLAYRAYYFMAQFDIVPQVGDNQMLMPSQVYYSPNMNFKLKDTGDKLMTSNFNSVDWGF